MGGVPWKTGRSKEPAARRCGKRLSPGAGCQHSTADQPVQREKALAFPAERGFPLHAPDETAGRTDPKGPEKAAARGERPLCMFNEKT